MKLLTDLNFSPLVVTNHGTGFFDTRRGELRKTFGVHVSPGPLVMRDATPDEARQFFRDRQAVRADLSAHYDRTANTGD